jgi:broad specificity phosphatase PhoE
VETVVHLIRHGEVHNPAGIRYGHLSGYGLSRRGEAQAQAAGRYLRGLGQPIAAMVSSPLERAIQTATLIQAELELPAFTVDDRLIEAPNQFDGRPRIAPFLPWNWRELPNPFVPSWAEPFADVARRMQLAIAGERVRHPDTATVLVSHQAPIWLARHAFEVGWGPPWLTRVRCSHASITTLRFAGDRYVGETYWAPG